MFFPVARRLGAAWCRGDGGVEMTEEALGKLVVGLGTLAFYVGLPTWFFCWRAAKKKEKEEYERKLLLQNPEAWERVKRLQGEKDEKRQARTTAAAKTGLNLAMRFLKK
jgi:hypothetical protein